MRIAGKPRQQRLRGIVRHQRPDGNDRLRIAIAPAVALTKGKAGDAVENAMMENARRVAAQIRASKPSLKSLAHGEDVVVLPARYDLDTGVVTWPN